MEKTMACRIRLVYHPVSNFEAHQLSDDQEVRQYVASSQVYAIGQRQEVLFSDLKLQPDSRELSFSLSMGSVKSQEYSIDLVALVPASVQYDDWLIEAGPKLIRIWTWKSGEPESERKVPVWFTPDKLLFDMWRGDLEFVPPLNVRPFTRFRLHYVGISKKADSMARLFDQAHKSRVDILTNEKQLSPGARLTDELTLFLFDVEPLVISTLDPGADDDAVDKFVALMLGDPLPAKVRIVADVEKALIKMVDPAYNVMKYSAFPAGDDGLADEGLARYAYCLDEDVEFITDSTSLFGSHEASKGVLMRNLLAPDIILVQGDDVWLVDPRVATGKATLEEPESE